MYKTVKKEIEKIRKYVEKETGIDIIDFLYEAEENYEIDDDGNKATCSWIINGLWNEADNYVDYWKENN